MILWATVHSILCTGDVPIVLASCETTTFVSWQSVDCVAVEHHLPILCDAGTVPVGLVQNETQEWRLLQVVE